MPVTGYMKRRRVAVPDREAPATPEQRHANRRDHLTTRYDESFVLSTDLRALAQPLADKVASYERPASLARSVDNYLESVHEAISVIVGWTAEYDGQLRTRHLADQPEARKRSIANLVALAQRPRLAEASADHLTKATWPTLVAAMAKPVDTGLADLLAVSHPPGAFPLRGLRSRSDLLADLLREHVDRAGLRLSNAVDTAVRRDEHERNRPRTGPKTADEMRKELQELGIHV
jgi:hypothetical protein